MRRAFLGVVLAGCAGLAGCVRERFPKRSRLKNVVVEQAPSVRPPPVLRNLRLDVDADLSETSVCDAVLKCGAAWSYRVGCNPLQREVCRRLFISQASTLKGNPFAPLIAVEFYPELMPDEWFVEANGVRVWSPGAGPSSPVDEGTGHRWREYGWELRADGRLHKLDRAA